MKAKKHISLLFLLPFLLFFVVFWVIPFISGGYMSLRDYSLTKGDQGFVGLANYAKILFSDSMYNESFMYGLKNTVLFVALSVPALVVTSLALALLVERLPKRTRTIFRTIYFASYSVSVSAVGAIFIWMLKGNGGYINNLLLALKIVKQPLPWLELQPYVWASVVIATVWWTIGYNMMLFVNALNEIDSALYEAAAIDGANFWAQIRYIILPNIKDVFFFVLMTTIIASFNVYGQPRLMTAGGPGHSTTPLIMVINDTIMQQNNMGVGTAMAVLLGIIMVLCSISQFFLTRAKDEVKWGTK